MRKISNPIVLALASCIFIVGVFFWAVTGRKNESFERVVGEGHESIVGNPDGEISEIKISTLPDLHISSEKELTELYVLAFNNLQLAYFDSDSTLATLEDATLSFIHSEGFSRREKLEALWKLLGDFSVDGSGKQRYIAQVLSSLAPVELIDQIIAGFYGFSDEHMQMLLLETLANSAAGASEFVEGALKLQETRGQIASFMEDQIYSGQNERLRDAALKYHLTVMDSQSATFFLEYYASHYSEVLSPEAIIAYSLAGNSDPVVQAEWLSTLMRGEVEEIPVTAIADTAIAMANGLDLQDVPAGTISELKDFIDQHEPADIVGHHSDYYAWFQAKLKLEGETEASDGYFMQLENISISQPEKLAAIIAGSDPEYIRAIQDAKEYELLESTIQFAIDTPNNDKSRTALLEGALMRLQSEAITGESYP